MARRYLNTALTLMACLVAGAVCIGPANAQESTVDPSPQNRLNCRHEVQAALTDLSDKLSVGGKAGPSTGDLFRSYDNFRTIVEKCEETKSWLSNLKRASEKDVRNAFAEFLTALPTLQSGPGISLTPGKRGIQIVEAEVPAVAKADPMSKLQGTLDGVRASLEDIGARVPSGPGYMFFVVILAVALACTIAMGLSFWLFLVVPRLRKYHRASIETMQVIQDDLESYKEDSDKKRTDAVQRLLTVMQRQPPVLAYAEPVPSGPAPLPVVAALIEPPTDLGAFEQRILADWQSARQNPATFEDRYKLSAVKSQRGDNAESTVLLEAGSIEDADMWAVQAPNGEFYVVPRPTLNVSVITATNNRRAEEKLQGVFTVKDGDIRLVSVAIATRRDSLLYIRRPGVVQYPAT